MGRPKRQVKIGVTVAAEPMSAIEQAAAERMLATLVARAYLADHPELLQTPGATDPHASAASLQQDEQETGDTR